MSLSRFHLVAVWTLVLGGLLLQLLPLRMPPAWKLPDLETQPRLSQDGRLLAYVGARGSLTDVCLLDLESGRARPITGLGNGSSYAPSLSADGRQLLFLSEASNLVPDDGNAVVDLFLCDTASGALRRLEPSARAGRGSCFAPSLEGTGRRAAFSRYADSGDRRRELVLLDLPTGKATAVDLGVLGPVFEPAVFAPTRPYLAFTAAGQKQLRSQVIGASLTDGQLTGRSLLSSAREGVPDGPSFSPTLGGGACAFVSAATNLIARDANGCQDVFFRQLPSGPVQRVAPRGVEPDGDSFEPVLSADGRSLAFTSYASNLVPGDTNGEADVFLWDRQKGTVERISPAAGFAPTLAGDGSRLVFASTSGGLFLWERATGGVTRLP